MLKNVCLISTFIIVAYESVYIQTHTLLVNIAPEDRQVITDALNNTHLPVGSVEEVDNLSCFSSHDPPLVSGCTYWYGNILPTKILLLKSTKYQPELRNNFKHIVYHELGHVAGCTYHYNCSEDYANKWGEEHI
jgi:hypothetical protein